MPDRQIKQGSNFANIVLEAQNNAIRRVAFYVAKPKFYEKHRGTLNERREKVVARISLRRAAMIGGLNSIHLAARQEAVEPDKDHPSRHPSSATPASVRPFLLMSKESIQRHVELSHAAELQTMPSQGQ